MSSPTSDGDDVEAFLASRLGRGLDYITREDACAALERFLACCRERFAKRPEELLEPEIVALVRDELPQRYAIGDPLGQRTIDVLRIYLLSLEDEGRLPAGMRLRRGLEEVAELFRERVRG